MPYTTSKHKETEILEISSFLGGLNYGVPPTQIADNECSTLDNMFFDRKTARLRTRYPISLYSNSTATDPIWGLHYWKGTWILATDENALYYLDGSLDPVLIGTLNGTERPVFCPYNDSLIIASGGTLERLTWDSGPDTLEDVPTGPDAKYVMQRYSRLVTAGDSDNPDRIQEGTYTDEETWGATDYGDVGYNDDTSICALAEAFDGMYIVFKRGYGGLKTYFCTSLVNDNPVSKLVTDGHAARTHAGVINLLGKVFVLEQHNLSALVPTDTEGKLAYDQSVGLKIAGAITSSATGHMCLYPKDAQLWVVPSAASSDVYVYHYFLNAWVRFEFTDRRVYSAFYDPVGDYLYLGCDDGNVYKYDHQASTYEDEDGAYTSRFVSKIFTTGNRESVLKSPRLIWLTLAEGSGSFRVKTEYGNITTQWSELVIDAPQEYVYDTQAGGSDELYVYDTRSGGDDEMYVYFSTYQQQKADYNQPTESFQFDVSISSGAIILERLLAEVSRSRRV